MVSVLDDPKVVQTRKVPADPIRVPLKDGSIAWAHPIMSSKQVPADLLHYMTEEFNREVERGQTYPHIESMTIEEFEVYWLSNFAIILVKGDSLRTDGDIPNSATWAETFLGTFYIKPNYPGRCSDVCNAGFVVNSRLRGKGLGMTLGNLYLQWAPRLGYTYSVFNLVFVTNIASIKIWDKLGFDRIGVIPTVAWLKGYNEKVDAIIFGKQLIQYGD